MLDFQTQQMKLLPQVLTYAHRSQWSIGHQWPPRHRTLFWAALVIPDELVLCCFSSASVSRLSTVANLASLPLPLRVPGQGLACGAGCWLPEGVSDTAPLPPQYLLGHWFLSHSLPQIFISDLVLPLDFVNAPRTGVEECLDLSLHRLCCPPCLTSVKQDWLHTGVEDAEFGFHADSSRCPDVFEHDKSCSFTPCKLHCYQSRGGAGAGFPDSADEVVAASGHGLCPQHGFSQHDCHLSELSEEDWRGITGRAATGNLVLSCFPDSR